MAAALSTSLATPGQAQTPFFDVPSGRLEDVLIGIGLQARVTVTITEPGLAALQAPGVRGRLSLRRALTIALKGNAAEAVFTTPTIVRIVRRRTAARPSIAVPSAPVGAEGSGEIVVNASKQGVTLGRYPGSVEVLELEPGLLAGAGTGNAEAMTRLLPTLGATNLGSGRNKFFIRGVSDSSFTGQTQATTGQYLGDVRLNYNAPDPDLNLYDMQRIEVLVGPQGALYGASSLGGIIRLVPNGPDLRSMSATMSASIGATARGGANYDGGAMLNIPLVEDKFAARLAVYGSRATGYIDAPAQDRQNINRTSRTGARLSLRASDLAGWTINVGLVRQSIRIDDGQYTFRGDPPFTRNAPIAQPFRNEYTLGSVTAHRQFGDAELATVTSVTRQALDTVTDATGLDGTPDPIRSCERKTITLLSQETRLSGGDRYTPWMIGLSVLSSASKDRLDLIASSTAHVQAEVTNDQDEAAVFGSYSHLLTPTLTATVGGRLTIARSDQLSMINQTELLQRFSRTDGRFAGKIGLDWRPEGRVSFYGQIQQGYRPGGLGITLSQTTLTTRKFAADDLLMAEAGARLGRPDRDSLSAEVAIFAADWRHIQADLIQAPGLPYTANIGRGFIKGLDSSVAWRATGSLTLNLAAFLNESNLSHPAAEFVSTIGEVRGRASRTLPNIARTGVRVSSTWTREIGAHATLRTIASLRYVGPSHLGFGSLLGVPQGNYTVVDTTISIDFGRFAVSVNVNNAGNSRANTFAYGNPYSLAQRNQVTPLRPRTISLEFSVLL